MNNTDTLTVKLLVDQGELELLKDLIDMTFTVLYEYPPEDDRYQDALKVLRKWFPEMEKEIM